MKEVRKKQVTGQSKERGQRLSIAQINRFHDSFDGVMISNRKERKGKGRETSDRW